MLQRKNLRVGKNEKLLKILNAEYSKTKFILEQLFFDAQISCWIGRLVVAFLTFNLVSIGRFLLKMDIENVSNGVFPSIELQRTTRISATKRFGIAMRSKVTLQIGVT